MQVFAKCDDFMSALMQRLQLDIPQFKLKRRVRVSCSVGDDGEAVTVSVTGLDKHNDQPYSFIKVSFTVQYSALPKTCLRRSGREEFITTLYMNWSLKVLS